MGKILIVAAHPDDEILGCGGTVMRLSNEGNDVYTLLLSKGAKSRKGFTDKHLNELNSQIKKANKIMNVKGFYIYDFPDNKFDSVPLLDIVKTIEKAIEEIKPNIIFTHFKNDLNIDHRLTYKAVITATRPIENSFVKTIYSFEILSSTEWNYPFTFVPNVFFNIEDTLDKKIEAIKCYKNEIREYPHPRSIKGIEILAQKRGMEIGLKVAEGFCLVRKIK